MENYVGDIVDAVRRDSRNEDLPVEGISDVGIQSKDILRYLNNAQQRLQSRISKKYPWTFGRKETIAVVQDQSDYTLSDNVFLNTRILMVEWSRSGSGNDWVRLPPISDRYRHPCGPGYPRFYERSDNVVTLYPRPGSACGSIRVSYERALDKLAFRIGTVSALGAIVDGSLTDVTFANDDVIEPDDLAAAAYVCFVDAYGGVGQYAVPTAGYDSATRVLTLSSNVWAPTKTPVYAVAGRYASSHSALVEDCERYLIEYGNWKMFRRDDSQSASETSDELTLIEKEILEAFQLADKDVKSIPIIDEDIMCFSNSW